MSIPGLFVVTVAIVVGAAALPKVEFVGFMVGGREILVG